jgi:hypothetical protein
MHPRALVLATLVAAAGSGACGGRVSGDPAPDSGASDGSSSSGSGHGGQVFAVCPTDAPTPGDACVTPNQGCIYRYSGGACVAFVCDASSHWVSSNEGC